MGYADTNGNAVMYDIDGSRYSENYKNELFFQEALSGTEAMQDTSADPYGSGWVLYYAVPVKENGRITGVLLAVQNASFFSDIIDISIFNGTGYANIVDSTGKFVIRTNNPEVSSDSYTLFDLGNVNADTAYSIKMNLLNGVSGNYRFQTQDGEWMTSVYMPVGYNGWYIQIAVPDRYIMGLFYATATGVMWTFAAVLAGFVILIFVSMRIVHREQMSLRLQAARFQIIQKTVRCNLYEYDVINDVLRYEFVKTDGSVLHGEQIHYLKEKKYEQQIREDFCRTYEHFVRRLIRTPGSSMIECPVKIGSEGYLWYRLYFQSVTGSKGNTITLIGSSVNINDLIMQRDLARAAAALDPLTGVLTGKAFTAQALEAYEKNRKEKGSILAVISIDRFQGLNDTIGRPEADKKLTMVGDLLPMAFGDESIIGRYEGAGFLVFLPEAEGISIEEDFRRMKKLLAKEQTAMPVKISCNMGALIIPAGCSMNFNAILDQAYYLAYRIKEDGKENFVIERL